MFQIHLHWTCDHIDVTDGIPTHPPEGGICAIIAGEEYIMPPTGNNQNTIRCYRIIFIEVIIIAASNIKHTTTNRQGRCWRKHKQLKMATN